MSDIAAFLAVCLADEEALISRLGALDRKRWHALEWYDGEFIDGKTARVDLRSRGGGGITDRGALPRAIGEFIAYHDPKRALAEIASKRKLLAMHEPRPYWSPEVPPSGRSAANIALWYCPCQCQDGVIEGDPYPCETARLLASPYATHPDYRPEWAI